MTTDYQAGRQAGAVQHAAGIYRPQDFTSSPDDFRQGYVDGWEFADDAARAHRTRTDVIAVLRPDDGDGTATVATMTYSIEPRPGQVVISHGETVTTVKRDAPRTEGAVWLAPYAVNCGQHGHVATARDTDQARSAALAHIIAHRDKFRVYASHDDAAGTVMCGYHAPLITGRPGVAAHLSLCPDAGNGARVCSPLELPDDAVCEQCARCGAWSTSENVWLI